MIQMYSQIKIHMHMCANISGSHAAATWQHVLTTWTVSVCVRVFHVYNATQAQESCRSVCMDEYYTFFFFYGGHFDRKQKISVTKLNKSLKIQRK